MDRTKTDFPAYAIPFSINIVQSSYGPELTAYARRCPFESAERGVGCPRVVAGTGARTRSREMAGAAILRKQFSYYWEER